VSVHRYIRFEEALVQLQVDAAFVESLAGEEVIHLKRSAENELVISAADVERVRVALLLTRELDVNMAGVEVIVHMRDRMMEMQEQFGDVLEAVVEEVRRRSAS